MDECPPKTRALWLGKGDIPQKTYPKDLPTLLRPCGKRSLSREFFNGIGQASRSHRHWNSLRKRTFPLLNHLVRAQQQFLRNRKPESSRGLEIDLQLELC